MGVESMSADRLPGVARHLDRKAISKPRKQWNTEEG